MNLARTALYLDGYYFVGDSRCRECRAEIEWWETPKGRRQPRDRVTLTPHHATCRRLKAVAAARAQPAVQTRLLPAGKVVEFPKGRKSRGDPR